MRIWFWGWLVVAVSIGLLAALTRDRASAPFAIGAAAAAVLEAAGATPGAEWLAFIGVSCVVFVALNRRWYRPRRSKGRTRRNGATRSGDAT